MTTSVGMGSCCLSGAVHQGQPTGREDTVGGLPTYVADGGSKDKSIVIITDIFGWKFNNVRLLADLYAKNGGFTVYIPDFHNGDSLPEEFLQDVEPPLKTREQLSMVDKGVKTTKVAATLPPWLVKHREDVSKPLIEGFISDVRKLPGTGKVGTVGFCWGGRYSMLMAQGQVDAAFAAHPALLAIPGDIDPITMPLSLAMGDQDSLLSNDDVQKIKDILDKKASPSEVRVYQNQVHGFALRGDFSSEEDKKAMDDTAKQAVDWFTKHLSG